MQDEMRRTFYRWKAANLLIVGCDMHLREVFEALNMAQKKVKS
jgi:hypothetical protein